MTTASIISTVRKKTESVKELSYIWLQTHIPRSHT